MDKQPRAGIIGIEIYWPSRFVKQTELEKFDKCEGKYTIGLGQKEMSFCSDNEDVNSLCLTVVSSLLRKYKIDPKQIGRLEVGSESTIDKSKSVKSVLMKLFVESDNHDIEGIDTINGCYGATNALFNAINWLESQYWDGRYAIVVAADNAVYANGAARPTGGCGAIAMLLARHGSISFLPPRSSYMEHVYDFYKPNSLPNYPVVDGNLSLACYFKALHRCYLSFHKKYKALNQAQSFSILKDVDFVVFHAPYCKIVRKGLARLVSDLNSPSQKVSN